MSLLQLLNILVIVWLTNTLENWILWTLEDNFNKFWTSEQEKSQKEIYETILRNNEIREKKEKFYEQLIEQESKLASLNTRLEEMKKKDYSKLLTDFISYIINL